MVKVLLSTIIVLVIVSCGRTGNHGDTNKGIDNCSDSIASRPMDGFYGFPWGTTQEEIIDSLGSAYDYNTPYFVGYRNVDFGGSPANVGFYFNDGKLYRGVSTWHLTKLGNPDEVMATAITNKYNLLPKVERDSIHSTWEWEWVWGDTTKTHEVDNIRLSSTLRDRLSLEIQCEYWSRKAQQQYRQEKMSRDF